MSKEAMSALYIRLSKEDEDKKEKEKMKVIV